MKLQTVFTHFSIFIAGLVLVLFLTPSVYAFESDGTIDFDSLSYSNGTLTVNVKNFSDPLDPSDSCDIASQLLVADTVIDFQAFNDAAYNPDSCSFDESTNTASFTFNNFPSGDGYFGLSAISTYSTVGDPNQWDTYINQPNGYFFSAQ